MTNKEAIEVLKEEWRINAEIFGKQFDEALDLAIKALEEKLQIICCFNCKYDYKSAGDEPCKYCENHCKWQAKAEEEEGGLK